MTNPQDMPRRKPRQSRYVRAQERRDAQKRADQRFYNAIFGVITLCVLIVIGLAALATSGSLTADSGSEATDTLVRQTFLGLTAIEWGGLAVVAIIALFMWRRITRK